MRRRIWPRAALLAFGAVAVIAGLTVYYSSDKLPPCLVNGSPAWSLPRDGTHSFEVVFPDRAACIFENGGTHKLVGAIRLPEAEGISAASPNLQNVALRTKAGVMTLDLRTGQLHPGGLAPYPSPILTVLDEEHDVMYVTRPGFLGFRVIDLRTANSLYDVSFKGFGWDPDAGPNPPSHGLSLAPDKPELWVLDAPNSRVHVYDVSGLPSRPPRQIAVIPLSKPISGDVRPCSGECTRLGSLQHSADGKYVYVGDSGDVIDTTKLEPVANLEALHNSRVHLEAVFTDGDVSFPAPR